MKEIHAYQCADGLIYEDERKAKAHDDDLLGQELDGLLKMFGFGGQLTRSAEHRALLRLLDKRAELRVVINTISAILEHGD